MILIMIIMSSQSSTTIGIIIGIILLIIGIPAIIEGLIIASLPYLTGVGVAAILLGLILVFAGGYLIHISVQKKPQPTVVPQPIQQPVSTTPTRVVSTATPTQVLPSQATGTKTVLAYLEAPTGRLIVSSLTQHFYRKDFVGIVSDSMLDVISQSKPQFTIYFRGGKFYIEDRMSTNGTLLNGKQIKGTGLHELKDGDIISPASAVNLKFRYA